MDMMPPETPSSLTQSIHQDTKAAFDRLTALQAWLASEQAAMPTLPDAIDGSTLSAHLAAIDAYWNAAPAQTGDDASRRTALARRLAIAARDLGELGRYDGHLDADALAMVRVLSASSTTALPPTLTVSELTVGDTPYAGVLLVQGVQTGERVLSFSTDR